VLFGRRVQAIFWKPLPSLVFGVLSAISGLLYTCLPETLGQVLSDTIEEVEQLQHQDDKQRYHQRASPIITSRKQETQLSQRGRATVSICSKLQQYYTSRAYLLLFISWCGFTFTNAYPYPYPYSVYSYKKSWQTATKQRHKTCKQRHTVRPKSLVKEEDS